MGSTPFPGLCTSCMLHMENVAISRVRCTCVIDSAWDKKKKKKDLVMILQSLPARLSHTTCHPGLSLNPT